MDEGDRQRMIDYVRRWSVLGPTLERLRDQEIRDADTQKSMKMFDEAFRIALRDLPPRESSGLVEWQRYARRWWQRD